MKRIRISVFSAISATLCLMNFGLQEVVAFEGVEILLADSVNEFSSSQGEDNWYYGYYNGPFNPADFQEMTVFSSGEWAVDPNLPQPRYWTTLDATGGHPNGQTTSSSRVPVEHWAVRRYVSEVTGQLLISGNIADLNALAGNGVIGRIFVGDSLKYVAPIGNGQSIGVNYEFAVDVNIGDTIDFAIDPRASHDWADQTRFTATITQIPEPTTFLLGLVGACVALGGRRVNRSV